MTRVNTHRNILRGILTFCIALGATSHGLAQAPEQLGQATEPNVRFRENIEQRQAPSGRLRVGRLPNSASDDIRIPGGRFTLRDVSITGATVFSAAELSQSYQSLIGQSADATTLQDLANAIQARYRQNGYFLARVRIPGQTIDQGVVRLNILEGYVADVELDGAPHAGHEKALDYLRRVTRERPLKFDTLERALLLANDLPGLAVSIVLRETNDGTGSVVLLARITRDTLRGFVSADNYGSVFTGRVQGTGGISSQGRTRHGEQVQAIVTGTGPFREADSYVGQAQGSVAVGDNGLRLRGTLSYGTSNLGAFLQPSDFSTDSVLGMAEAIYPLIRRRDLSLHTIASFEAVNTDIDQFDEPAFAERTRVVALRGILGWKDRRRGLNSVDVSIRTGLPFLGANRRGDPETTRPGAGGSFVSLVGNFERVQGVTDRIYVVGRATGQITSSNVLAAEEFTVGGPDIGRGFNVAQIAGDRGIAGTVEVQFRDSVETVPFVDAYQVFGFIDYGRARSQFDDESQTITSAGAGVRTVFNESALGEVFIAFPFGGRDSIRDGEVVGDLDPSIQFRLTETF